MKTTLTNVEDTHFRVISIKAGKVLVMTCKKGRTKGPAKSLAPSPDTDIEAVFKSQVEEAAREGFTIEVDSDSVKSHSETSFYAEIPEQVWDSKALETFLSVDMVIPVDVSTKLAHIEGSDLYVRRNFSNYVVQGTLKAVCEASGKPLVNFNDHIISIIHTMAPLVVLSSKLIMSTDAPIDGISDPNAINPGEFIKANLALVPDDAMDLLADNGHVIRPADISRLTAISQDCSFCV